MPSSYLELGSALASIRACALSGAPLSAAQRRGVTPSSSFELGSAPVSIMVCNVLMSPVSAAV